jgi:shikimate kinase
MIDSLQGISIFLIGMMGTGKTTVGQVLAQHLSYRFFDSDDLIERVAQQSINEIFANQGEAYFREIESKVLAQLSAQTKSVIATGGGIVLSSKNWSYLHHGLIIWLDASVEILKKRLAQDTTRPLLQDDLTFKLSSLSEKRRALYQQADLHIHLEENQTPAQITAKLIEQIPTVLKAKS